MSAQQLTTGLADEKLIKESLNAVEDSIFANHYSLDDPNEKIQTFVENYKNAYKENPSSFSALGYDAVYMVKQAFEEGGLDDPQGAIDAMKAIDYEGVTGEIKFDENNNPIKAVSMIKVINGEYKLDSVVTPQE